MKRVLLLSLLLFSFPLWAQVNTGEQLSFIGLTLQQVIERFGAPSTVFTARGNELWQDDVVFRYAEGDFYIYQDRVWKVRFTSAHGISQGERKAAVLLTLGNTVQDRGDHVLFPISGRNWPLMMRINFNNSGIVTAIYIYRPDFQ